MDLQTLLNNLLFYLGYRDNEFCRAYLEQHYYNYQAVLDGSKQYQFDLENKVDVKEMSRTAYNAGYAYGLGYDEVEDMITECPYENDLLKEIWHNSYGEGYADS